MHIVQGACLVLNMVTLLSWLTVKYVKLAKPKRTRMRQRQSLWKATLCSSGWRMSGDLYLGTVLRRTTSCQLSTSERFIPEQAKGWKGQVWPQHLRWGRNLLLPPSTVCCNGGLGKEKAPALIMDGTPLSVLTLSGNIFQAVPISHLCTSNFSRDINMLRDYLGEKRCEFAIKWEGGGLVVVKVLKKRCGARPQPFRGLQSVCGLNLTSIVAL